MPNRRPGRHALLFIFLTVLIDVTGLGIIIPVMPDLVQALTGRTVAEAAVIGGRLIFVYALMQFICAPIVGGLSDHFGRRPMLLLSLAGFSIDYFLMGFAPTLGWLFLGRILSGVFGATYTTAGAYIADVSPPEKRAQNFGLIGAAFGLGFIVGPALGGIIGKHLGVHAPFIVAGALALANLVYGFIVLPETLKPENRRAFSLGRANPLGSLAHMRLYPAVLGLLGAFFLFQLGHQAYTAVWSYFTIERFEWDEALVGYSLGAIGIAGALVQGGLTRSIIPRLGEAKTLYLGFALAIVSYFGFGLATQGWMIYAWIPVAGLAGLIGPALQGLMANRVPDDSQGELQGAVASLRSLSSIIGPVVLTSIFARTSAPDAAVYLPGSPFLVGGALTVLALVVAARVLARRRDAREAPSTAP